MSENKSKTFSDFLENNGEQGESFVLTIKSVSDSGVRFYIHPDGRDGETFDAMAMGSSIIPDEAINKISKKIKA